MNLRKVALGMALVAALGFTTQARAGLVITPTFTANFDANFGANAAAAQASWIAAANVFETNFSDNIHVNITVDAVAGTGILGQSSTPVFAVPFATMQTDLKNDATTADDKVATGAGGSASGADPTMGSGTWWVTRAQQKAIGERADDLTNDGTTTFGAGFSYTFAGPIAPGTIDFEGVAAHEISEVMGRIGISGGSIGGFAPSFSLYDLFSWKGAGSRGLGTEGGNNFSIDSGNTLLKAFNDAFHNGGDSRDWESGTNDAFNAFSSDSVANPVTDVDLRVMDVIGYDRITGQGPPPSTVPEPASLTLLGIGVLALGGFGWRRRQRVAA
jgi:hypothetical protein